MKSKQLSVVGVCRPSRPATRRQAAGCRRGGGPPWQSRHPGLKSKTAPELPFPDYYCLLEFHVVHLKKIDLSLKFSTARFIPGN